MFHIYWLCPITDEWALLGSVTSKEELVKRLVFAEQYGHHYEWLAW